MPKLDLKILLDSGASDSIINPEIAYHKFSDFIFKEPFSVTGLGKRIDAEDNLMIPLLSELGITEKIHLHVVEWNRKFDALLGSEDLKRLGATIDYKTETLIIKDQKMPFFLEYNSLKIKPRATVAQNTIKIPVSLENGQVIFPETQLDPEIIIPESITTAVRGYCIFPIEKDIEVHFSERVQVAPLVQNEIRDPPRTLHRPKIGVMIRTSHLNSEERKTILELCNKYYDVFYDEASDLSFSNAVKHQIRTVDDQPVYVKSFRHPHAMKDEIQKQVQKLLDNKIIRPSISPYSAPVWIVPKKTDASGKRKFRMVIDYRKLNEKTIEDKYPLPRIEEILDNLGKCSYFTTLDLAQGFHQIEMDSDSIEKTAFSVNNGHYEYLRMPFGLKNAPSTFQRAMDNIFREYLHRFCFIYMDDVVVFSKSLEEHKQHLQRIFSKVREFNLKIQLDKSEFLRKDVEFLGHVITPEGIKPNPTKIEAIEKFPLPKTTKEIKSFLGLVGYYRRFIANFANLVSPLTKCLKKGAKIIIDDPDYLAAFHSCRELLMNAPILAYPDFSKQFRLTTDASNVAVAGVLSQANRPIAYYSRTLNSAEKNYSTIEKELLAILDSTKHFRPYLFGQKFVIETDHNPLVWLYKIKEPNSRLIRWKLKLEEFDFNIIYKKGRENYVADALSRIEINNHETDETDSIRPSIDEIPDPMEIDLDQITETRTPYSNPSFQEILADLQETSQNLSTKNNKDQDDNHNNDNDDSSTDTIHSTNEDNGKGVPISERPVNVFHNRLLLKIGDTCKRKLLKPFNRYTYLATIRNDMIEIDLSDVIRETFRPDQTYCVYFVSEELKKPFLKLIKTIFNYSAKIYMSNILCKDVTDTEAQKNLVAEYHENNHNGISETFKQLKNKFFWPNMINTITQVINTCDICLQAKYERHPYNPKFSGPLLAKRPFDTLHLDTFSFQNSKFLTVIDLFSRYSQAYFLKDGTSLTVLNKLRHFFAHHNIPKRIVCDEGREFKNHTFTEFCKLHKIELHFTTVNNPSSNSPVERLHSTLIEKLRTLKIKNPRETPANLMISAVLIYNQSIHSSTGFSPFHLLYGPYERLIEFDFDMTVFEQYNEKRKQELLPFYNQIYEKNKQKAEKVLEKRNERKEDPPDLQDKDIYVERNRPRKTDPPFEKIRVTAQDGPKISGITQKARPTTANIKTIKRLRTTVSKLQEIPRSSRDDDQGPSGLQNRK